VLRVLNLLARKQGMADVWFTALPYRTPLCARVRRGQCRVEVHYKRAGGPMIRMLNLRSTLEKLAGELSRRLDGSHMSAWRGELLVADGHERVTLRIARGKVQIADGRPSRHAVRGGEHLAQLIIGSYEPGEIIETGGLRLAGEARCLVEVLFPNEYPEMCGLDRF
jgi:hypothetical protein